MKRVVITDPASLFFGVPAVVTAEDDQFVRVRFTARDAWECWYQRSQVLELP